MIKIDLEGNVAIVTGARRGIGRSIALTLAKAGADIVVNDINLEDAKKVSEEIEALGRRSLPIEADVTSWDEVNLMAKKSLDEFGKIDILVNNAGGSFGGSVPFWETNEGDWDNTVDLCLKGAFLCSKVVVKDMLKRNKGKIVNIASFCAVSGGVCRNVAAYDAAKAGVIILTKVMALELAPYHINVNSISPGTIETPMTYDKIYSDPKKTKIFLSYIPWGRQGRPEDIANAVLFLVSNYAEYITGVDLLIDGGLTIQPIVMHDWIKMFGSVCTVRSDRNSPPSGEN